MALRAKLFTHLDQPVPQLKAVPMIKLNVSRESSSSINTAETPQSQSQLQSQSQSQLQSQSQSLILTQSQSKPTPKSKKQTSAIKTVDPQVEWKAHLKRVSATRDGTGRLLSELFQKLPDAMEYGDYYQLVIHIFTYIHLFHNNHDISLD